MKKMTKFMSVLLAAAMLLTMAACGGPAENNSSTTPSSTTKPNGNVSDGKVNYTVKVQTAGGMVLENVDIVIRQGDSTVDVGRTDAAGTKVFKLAAGKEYTVELANVPAGYDVRDSYSFDGNSCVISLVSSVIEGENLSGKKFKLGDIMYDFTITDHSTYICPECGQLNDVQHAMTTDGKYVLDETQVCTECETELKNASHPTTTLAETLEQKKMVMLNFWYNGCSWCYKEFPAINNVYGAYKDKLEIFALDDYPGQTAGEVAGWRNEMNLDFPMGLLTNGLGIGSFGGGGWPMTVIIDRYGMIAMAHRGAITSEQVWDQLFTYFTAEDYQQKLIVNYEDIITQKEVTEVFPGSDAIGEAINQGEINVNYHPASKETDGADWEYIWPFVTTTYDGETCIKASNSGIDSSFAILYADVELKAGQAVGFDYIISSDLGNDVAFVIVNGQDVYQMSGYDEVPQWKACYPWVALEDGTYQVAICYAKDGSNNVADDTIYIKNMRVIDKEDMEVDAYIPRQAAVKQEDGTFEYVDVFFNEADGYYHVNSVDGPLLLANLMGYTQFCEDNYIYYMALNREIIKDGHDYCEDLTPFANYANNATLSGYCTVTRELAEILKVVAEIKGYERTEGEWLKICEYYQAYGPTGTQLEDPIKGLAPFSAPEAVMGTWQLNENTNQWEFTPNPEVGELPEGDYNFFYYDRVIMPRGKFFKFTPEVSGAYRVTSHASSAGGTEAWLFIEENFKDRQALYTYGAEERIQHATAGNVSMVYYMEAGQTYYINVAFWDVAETGYIPFDLEFLGETYDKFRQASPGFFTFEEGAESYYISGGIDVILGEDGIYYHKVGVDENGEPILGSALYADFSMITSIFSDAIMDTPAFDKDGNPILDENGQQIYIKGIISKGGFDFTKNEYDHEILNYLAKQNGDVEATREYLKRLWGVDYDVNAEAYKLEEILSGVYHGKGVDMTSAIEEFLDDVIVAEGDPTDGCVIVTAELAELLQMLMDKYTFPGVENSWAKLCYYYEYLGQ